MNAGEERKHIAYLLPHTDVTSEMDCAAMLPGYVLHVERMWLDSVSEKAEQHMVEEEFPRALQYLKGVVPYHCAIFGCTSASAANGRAGMEALERQMSQVLDCPAITALGAVLRGIEARQAKSEAVFTPYTQEVNRFFRATLESFGVSVSWMAGMGLSDDGEIAALNPEAVFAFAEGQKASFPGQTDLCFFACTNVRAAEIRDRLAQCLGRPCITSNQCIIDYIRSLP